jgi:hypothetical protein
MTEAEWLASLEPLTVFQNLKGKPSTRKMRLASTACCRHTLHLLKHEISRIAVEAAELYADKLITSAEVHAIEEQASEVVELSRQYGSDQSADATHAAALCLALWADAKWGTQQVLGLTEKIIGRRTQMDILRCVFRISYRPVTFHPSWLTPTAVALANGIYAERAFDRMPMLADALEEAGCDNVDVLLHCRGDCPHVRGCWVIDGVLGKE